MPAVRSPTLRIRSRIDSTVNTPGSTSATSSHASGAETRASAVGRTEYAQAIVRSHVWPLAVRRQVEVDQHLVRLLDVLDARVPRVQLDAAEVDHPCQGGGVVDNGEDGGMSAGEPDELLADVRRMLRHPLLMEEV